MFNILRKIQNYRDDWGLITQANRDGGDTASRTGAFYSLIPCEDRFKKDLLQLQANVPGRYLRHPSGLIVGGLGRCVPWYSDKDNFTRDQAINLQSALAINGFKPELLAVFKARAKRFFLHFNTKSYDDAEPVRTTFPDLPSPSEVGQFVRGLQAWYLVPLLWVTDIELLVSVLLANRTAISKSAGDDVQKLVCTILSADRRYATLFSKLAKKLLDKQNTIYKIKLYFSESNGDNGIEPLGELFEYRIQQL